MANKKITTSELDFDQIKLNLKSFLQGQTEFQDYDFDGSAMSVLLDVLAYNTHYNALYTNLAVNESFLDSASKRSSVVSLAKEIGYIPGSVKCPTATVDITVANTTSTPISLILPKYSAFQTTINGDTFNFYTLEDVATVLTGNQYVFSGVQIREGTPLSFKYIAAEGQRYIIPNKDVDLSTMFVRIQENSTSSVFESFNRFEDILTLSGTDKVFFVKEVEDELYELEFGNDVIGKALQNGNVVNIDYFVSNKDLANGAKTFSYNGSSLLGGTVSVVTTIPAQGGVDKEDIETIRYNAPRAYQAQNRGVTTNDYKSIILSQYDEAESVNVWGGEDNLPPVYGKVYISIKPKSTTLLTKAQKDYVVSNILKTRNVVTITPEIVDPEYIYLEVNTTVYYNPKTTNKTSEQLKTLVIDSVKAYNDNYLNSFDGIFRFSQFSSEIDATDDSIVSNITTLKLHRQVAPKYNLIADYEINIVNPIYNSGVPEQSIISSGFYMEGSTEVMYLEDKPTLGSDIGTFSLFYYDINLNKQYSPNTIGAVEYSKGLISITGLNITGIKDAAFELIIKPQSNDVVSVRNQLVQIPEDTTTVNVIVDKVSTGDSAGNSKYIFTSSRN